MIIKNPLRRRKPTTATPGQEKEEPYPVKVFRWTGVIAVALSAVLALVLALYTTLRPRPEILRATIDARSIEPGVSLREYLKRTDIPSNSYTAGRLDQVGVVVYFTVEIQGFRGRVCPLSWSMYDADTNGRLSEAWAVNQTAVRFVPEARTDSAVSDLWAPVPGRQGKFFIRLELFDDKKVRLAYANTEIFKVPSGP